VSLIEQLGGYEKAKSMCDHINGPLGLITDGYSHYTKAMVVDALLEYRRQHNIFERNDYVVNRDIKYSDELNIVSSSNDKALWFFGKIYGGFVKSQFRHATDAEIKAGKRLEVNDAS